MRTRHWLLPIVSILIFSGCTSIQCGANKGQFLEQYERFIQEAKEAATRVTESPWDLYDERLEVYLLDCYENFKTEMSWSDRATVMIKALRYYYWRHGSHMVHQLKNEENVMSAYILHEVKSIRAESGEDMEEILDDEWNEITNVFLEDLGNLRRQLLESIEQD